MMIGGETHRTISGSLHLPLCVCVCDGHPAELLQQAFVWCLHRRWCCCCSDATVRESGSRRKNAALYCEWKWITYYSYQCRYLFCLWVHWYMDNRSVFFVEKLQVYTDSQLHRLFNWLSAFNGTPAL